MTGYSSQKNDLLNSLRRYTSLFEARKDALAQLSRTSAEMRSTLTNSQTADISDVLARRDSDCKYFAEVCHNKIDIPALVDNARRAAESANSEVGNLARSILSIHTVSQTLAEEILTCQSECEAILKKRLEATANAIRESKQRRKLDAAYGPACTHESPIFLDKQQ